MEHVFVWTLRDVIALALFALTIIAISIIFARVWWRDWRYKPRKRRCKHDGGVNKSSLHSAICRQCGANLGCIIKWRKNNLQSLRDIEFL